MNTIYLAEAAAQLTQREQMVTGISIAASTIITISLICGLVTWVLFIIAWWKIFEKAGLQGWKSLIPIYGQYCLYRISGMSGWLSLLPIIPLMFFAIAGIDMTGQSTSITDAQAANPLTWVGFVLGIVCGVIAIAQVIKLADAFGKGTGFKVASVFFPNITSLILAFGKAKYNKKALHD